MAPEKSALLEKLEKEGIPVVEMSTVTQEGVISLRDKVSTVIRIVQLVQEVDLPVSRCAFRLAIRC